MCVERAAREEADELPQEYTWEGTDGMAQYSFSLYTRYENMRKLRLGNIAADIMLATTAAINSASDKANS